MVSLAKPPIVFDNGSTYMKAGFAGEDSPRVLLPSVIGHAKFDRYGEATFVGERALRRRSVLQLKCPVLQGLVTDWGELDTLWRHIFEQELHVDPKEHALLVADYPLLPRHNRELMAQFAFEEFDVPGLFIVDQSVLAMYAYGLTSGLSVDIGKQSTCITPVIDMQIIPEGTHKLSVGGRDITNRLKRLLVEQGYTLNRSTEHEIVRDIKEHFCFVSDTPEPKEEHFKEKVDLHNKYHLPDGTYLTLGIERTLAPELLFQKGTASEPGFDLARTIHECIEHCDPNVRPLLYANVVPSGGGTMFPGFVERLCMEIRRLLTDDTSQTFCEVHSNGNRKYAVWIGGSILASLKTFPEICVTRTQYDEEGIRSIYK